VELRAALELAHHEVANAVQDGRCQVGDGDGHLAGTAPVEDPPWPGLAVAIDRAHAAGWDGRDGVPRLVGQQEMPDRNLMRELRYR
jgi:hypothetical protein